MTDQIDKPTCPVCHAQIMPVMRTHYSGCAIVFSVLVVLIGAIIFMFFNMIFGAFLFLIGLLVAMLGKGVTTDFECPRCRSSYRELAYRAGQIDKTSLSYQIGRLIGRLIGR